MERLDVEEIRIPKMVISETELYLGSHAIRGQEGMVFWSGVRMEGYKCVRTCLYPKQHCTAVSVNIPLEEAQRINAILHQKGEILLAQVHSHPGSAFHSYTDSNFAITFTLGFVSIVTPFFGQDGLSNLDQCGIWIHEGYGKWRRLSKDEVKGAFKIICKKERNDGTSDSPKL